MFNPDGNGKTTIRVGGGLLYDSVATFIPYRMVAQNPPFGPQVTETSGPYQFSDPWGLVPGGNPFPLPTPGKNVAFPPANAEVVLPPHLHAPSVGQWNVSLQHQFADNWVASISYLGNKTSHLWIGNDLNPAVYIPGICGAALCSTTSNTQARRVLTLANPKAGQYYSQVTIADDGANANYNGLLASIEHRFSRNYTVLANYTWSKCMGIAPITSLSNPGVTENPYNIRQDYGPCTYDVPQLFNASVVYASKFGGNGMLSRILSNWNIAPLVRYTSGLPVNPTTGKDNSLTGIGNDRPNVITTAAYTGASHGKKYQYVNPALFAPNALGTFGNAGHNSLRGPGYFDVDLAISREFRLLEKLTLHARVEAFNALNHPNFMLPVGNISAANFGQITTAFDPRIMQASMKLTF